MSAPSFLPASSRPLYHAVDLSGATEQALRQELRRRYAAQASDLCDYCHRGVGTLPACEREQRHNASPRPPPRVSSATFRLVRMLRDRPELYLQVLDALETPTITCEGHDQACTAPVLWPTTSLTAYEWDGRGEDPNRRRLLCVPCSEAYKQEWADRWDEYNAGRI